MTDPADAVRSEAVRSEAVLLEDVPVATLVVDADTSVTAANELAADLLGRPVSALRGCALDDLLAGATGGGTSLPRAGSWDRPGGVSHEQPVELRASDGGTVRCQVSGRSLRDADGGLRGAVLALRRSDPCPEPGPSAAEVVTTVAHELRSPLTSIKGYTSLLLHRWDRVPDEQRDAMLTEVHHDADRVARLLAELLDVGRLEAGRLHLRPRSVDLRALAEVVVEEVGGRYEDLTCDLSFPDGLPHASADLDKVTQVLTNLVENAAKYGSPSGVAITGSHDGDRVTISVADRGAGLPSSELPLVFTKFYRRSLARPSGAGLGLWLGRRLVEANGGALTVERRSGGGTTFRLALPIDPSPTRPPPVDPLPAELEQRDR